MTARLSQWEQRPLLSSMICLPLVIGHLIHALLAPRVVPRTPVAAWNLGVLLFILLPSALLVTSLFRFEELYYPDQVLARAFPSGALSSWLASALTIAGIRLVVLHWQRRRPAVRAMARAIVYGLVITLLFHLVYLCWNTFGPWRHGICFGVTGPRLVLVGEEPPETIGLLWSIRYYLEMVIHISPLVVIVSCVLVLPWRVSSRG